MRKVLMLGNDSSVKGGITTVINQFREHEWKNIKLKFIPTYKDNNSITKIVFFIIAYIRIIFNLIFNRPDIVHMHMSYKASFTRTYMIHELCKIFKVKDIIHLHGSEFKKWYDTCNYKKKNKIKKLLRECNVMVVLGSEWKRRIKEIEPNTNVLIINNTVKIQNEVAKYNDAIFNILFLGVLIKRKGIDNLLYAVNLLKEKNILNNTKFIIAGTGDEEKNLKEKAKSLNINEYIDFIGWVDSKQKEELIKKSQLMVLPSYNEGLPMCILEAMSFGLPIIATNVGDISEAVFDEKNGFLIESGNYNQLAESLEKIIKLNKNEWKSMSLKSKKIIEEKFSNAMYFKIFEKIYNN